MKNLDVCDVVAARDPADGKWYRAKVVQLQDDDWSNIMVSKLSIIDAFEM